MHSRVHTLLISTVSKCCLLYLSGWMMIAVEFIWHITEVSGFWEQARHLQADNQHSGAAKRAWVCSFITLCVSTIHICLHTSDTYFWMYISRTYMRRQSLHLISTLSEEFGVYEHTKKEQGNGTVVICSEDKYCLYKYVKYTWERIQDTVQSNEGNWQWQWPKTKIQSRRSCPCKRCAGHFADK